ncbi:ADP-ribosylglycohydrolase family protein [Nonomuraea antimicrobica]
MFVDGWGLVSPGDPERAAALARAAASVSHDELAVDAACLIAAMEALAFTERDMTTLIERGLEFVTEPRLHRLVEEVVTTCSATDDWREVRDWIEDRHGYANYPGNSPMQTNHAAVLMSLLMGGDDFQRSLSICTSAGWDTDSNTGNVGCLNGIRLGLAGLSAGADLRTPVADRLFAVSSDGGECVTDAVRETRKILAAGAELRGEPVPPVTPRFAFEFPGSTQGFMPYPGAGLDQALTSLTNTGRGLTAAFRALAPGTRADISVETYCDPRSTGVAGTSYFEVVGSPSLYGTQTVRATLDVRGDRAPAMNFFIDVYGDDKVVETRRAERRPLAVGVNRVSWTLPDTGGKAVYRLGIEFTSGARLDGSVTLVDLDWAGAPEDFRLGMAEELSPDLTPWTTDTAWLRTFTSSAANLAPDYTTTFSLSHPEENGIVTIGTADWSDYSVASRITFNQQDAAGLVGRARGHRRYYAGLLSAGRALIVRRRDGAQTVLASAPVDHRIDDVRDLEFRLFGERLSLLVDGAVVAEAREDAYAGGGAGLVVDRGAILARGFSVQRWEPRR